MSRHKSKQQHLTTNVGAALEQARRRQHARRVAMIAAATGPIVVNRLPGRAVTIEELS